MSTVYLETAKQAIKLLGGQTITRVELHPFDDGRGGKAYNPVLTFSSGARLWFIVQETESLEYGVTLAVSGVVKRAGGAV
jgi:hypothetical protein